MSHHGTKTLLARNKLLQWKLTTGRGQADSSQTPLHCQLPPCAHSRVPTIPEAKSRFSPARSASSGNCSNISDLDGAPAGGRRKVARPNETSQAHAMRKSTTHEKAHSLTVGPETRSRPAARSSVRHTRSWQSCRRQCRVLITESNAQGWKAPQEGTRKIANHLVARQTPCSA